MGQDMAERVHFDPDSGVMEIDFEGVQLQSAADVDAVYDQLEDLIAASGREQWYLLVNERNFSLYPEAWVAHANRGRKLRQNATLAILRHGMLDRPADGRYVTRAEAVTELDHLRATAARKAEAAARRACRYPRQVFEDRITLDPDARILQLDLSGFELGTPGDVDGLFDALEHAAWKTGQPWYLMVDFNAARILPDAWARYAVRSRKFVARHCLGSVRYAASQAPNASQSADEEDQDPNFCADAATARARIETLKAAHTPPASSRLSAQAPLEQQRRQHHDG